MRRLTPLSLYNRKAFFSKATPKQLGESLLGYLAAGETPLLAMFVRLADCGDPWQDKLEDAGSKVH